MKGPVYRIATGLLVLAWMAVIYCFSAQNADLSGSISGNVCDGIVTTVNDAFRMNMTEQEVTAAADRMEFPVRKMAHMFEFAVLGIFSFAFFHGVTTKERRKYLYSVLTVIVYASADELHQFFSDGRAARVSDVLIDTAGALIGLAFLYFILKFVRSRCEMRPYPVK